MWQTEKAGCQDWAAFADDLRSQIGSTPAFLCLAHIVKPVSSVLDPDVKNRSYRYCVVECDRIGPRKKTKSLLE